MSFRTVVPLVALVILAALPLSFASSQEPEISDGLGDAQALKAVWPAELDETREKTKANLSAYDIIRAYVGAETSKAFSVFIEVQDMDKGLKTPDMQADTPASGAPEEVFLHADYEARFTVGGVDYLARASSDLDGSGDTPKVFSNFTLSTITDKERLLDAIGGVVSPEDDRIVFTIDKDQVGSPQNGAKLSKFYVTSGNEGIVVDQAPDATADVPGGRLNVPAYGMDYTFGQYPQVQTRAFTLKPQGETSGEAKTDDTITFIAVLENQAASDEEVVLTTKGLASGWSVVLGSTVVQLSPGSNKVVTIDVTPGQGAGRVGVLIVQASSTKGDLSRETSFTVRHVTEGTAGGGGSGGTAGPDGPLPDGSSPSTTGPDQALSDEGKDGKDSPGIGLVAVLAVGLLGLGMLRRRRD